MQSQPRVALVTAGTGGIGRGIAEALLAGGATVFITGRGREKGDKVAAELSSAGLATFLTADSNSQHDVERAVDRILESESRLDILVNNAGGSSGFAPVHELSDTAWSQALNLNVTSAFWATRRVLPAMLRQGFGRIVNISSVQGKQVNRPNASHYVTAKHALNGFTKAVAFEYGRGGITCNAVCVGAVETDLMQSAGPKAAQAAGITYEQFKQRYADQTMTGRLNLVSEVSAMVALLVSDAGSGITGSILNVDGGICAY